MQTNKDFPPLGRCMETLEVLIKVGDVNGIHPAEKAVDEFLSHQPDVNRRTGDLHILEQEIDQIWGNSTGPNREFVNLIGDYIASKRKELQPNG